MLIKSKESNFKFLFIQHFPWHRFLLSYPIWQVESRDPFILFTFSMNSGPKNGRQSASRCKVALRFCMIPKVQAADCSPGNTSVYLNVYDLTPVNGYIYWAGLGVFHTGVEG